MPIFSNVPPHPPPKPVTAAASDSWPARAAAWLTPQRLTLYPPVLLVLTLVVYALGLLRSPLGTDPSGSVLGQDYLAFFMAGDLVANGHAARLYDLAAQTEYQRLFMATLNPAWSGTCLYLNPPHYAWAMSLLARLGYGPSLAAWWTLSLACFAATAWQWRRWLGPARIRPALLLAICSPPWFWALAGGQNTFFSLFILTTFCTLLLRGRPFWAGLALSLLLYKFQLIALPAAFLLLTGRWRALLGLAGGTLATLTLTLVTVGGESLGAYAALAGQFADLMRVGGFDIPKQHSWHGFVALLGSGWLPPPWLRALTAGASLATVALLLHTWRGPWLPVQARLPLQLAATLVAAVVTSPHLFHYDMLLLALPAVLAGSAAIGTAGRARARRLTLVLAALFVWLAVSPYATKLAPLQLSPVLMLLWLWLLGPRGGDVPAPVRSRPVAASLRA